MIKATFFAILAAGWLIYEIFFKPEGFQKDTYSWYSGLICGLLIYNLVSDFKDTKFFKEVKNHVFGK